MSKRSRGIDDAHARLSRLPADLTILVAEDNETNRLVIDALLQSCPVRLVFANDGAEALERLAEEEFDGALIDIRMPRMSGTECLVEWRQKEIADKRLPMPTVAFSAHVMEEQIEQYHAIGFDRYLSKPIDIGRLVETLDWIVEKRQERRKTA